MISLALKYLFSRKRQSLFTLLGIFLGAAGYVTISGFFVGFQTYLVEKLVNNSAHVFIQARQEFLEPHTLDKAFFKDEFNHAFWKSIPAGKKDYARIEKPQDWFLRLKADPRVQAYSPQMSAAGLFSKANASVSATLIGCLPNQQAKVSTIASNMIEGNFSDIGSGGNRIVVGKELLKQLGAKLYQTINITVGNNAPVPFKIMGYFESGNRQADLQAYGALSDVQKVKHTLNTINEIHVRLFDYTMASKMADTWSTISQEKIESWDTRSANILSIFTVQTIMRYLVVAVIMLVAGFGIYNVLMMTVSQKLKDIAILQAMGYEASEVKTLFLAQGLILGVVGAFFGLIVGYIICRYLQTINVTTGPMRSTKGDGHLQIALTFAIYAQASLLSILSAVTASYLPARSASKLNPIEIIRGGVE